MIYHIERAPAFVASVDRQIDYLLEQGVSVERIGQWLDRLYDQVDSLDETPHRFPVDENQTRRLGVETRKINFGDYLIYFQVTIQTRRVDVVGFRHAARRPE